VTATEVPSGPAADPAPAAGHEVPETKSWGWHLMQVTSWLLLVLVPVHVFSTWVFHDPGHFGVALYVDRWHQVTWRLFDGALVVLAFLHGGVGLNGMCTRRIHRAGVRTALSVVIGVVLGVVGVLAVSTILSFNVS